MPQHFTDGFKRDTMRKRDLGGVGMASAVKDMQEKFIDLQERYTGKEFPSSVVVGLHEDPKKNI